MDREPHCEEVPLKLLLALLLFSGCESYEGGWKRCIQMCGDNHVYKFEERSGECQCGCGDYKK